MRYVALMGLLVAAFAAGTGLTDQTAMAAVGPVAIAKCDKYECKNVHAYWVGNGVATISVYHATNTTNVEVNGVTDLFTPNSNRKKPLAAPNGVCDFYKYPTCTPLCGKDAAAKWQAPQEVTPPANGGTMDASGLNKTLCTLLADGEAAPKSANQDNQSSPGTPPGN